MLSYDIIPYSIRYLSQSKIDIAIHDNISANLLNKVHSVLLKTNN